MEYSTPTDTGHIGPTLAVTPLSLRHLIQLSNSIYLYGNIKKMASTLNVDRQASAAVGDKYLSPKDLIDNLKEIVGKKVDKKVLLWDPAAHDGRLLSPLKNIEYKVKNSDILPENKEVERIDFLSDTTQRPPDTEQMLILMNPPYELPKTEKDYRSGVARFLNKSSTLLKQGEYVITVAPAKNSTYTALQKIDPELILKEEYTFMKKLKFIDFNKGNKPSNQPTIIQVWQKGSEGSKSPTSQLKLLLTNKELKEMNKKREMVVKANPKQKPPFETDPICYIQRSGTGFTVGRIGTSKKYMVGKNKRVGLDIRWKNGKANFTPETYTSTYPKRDTSSALAVYTDRREKVDEIIAKLSLIYAGGYYARYLGQFLFVGTLTIPSQFTSYLYENYDNIEKAMPSRETLGITSIIVGDRKKLDAFNANASNVRKNMKAIYQQLIEPKVKVEIEIKKEADYWKSSKKVFPKLKF